MILKSFIVSCAIGLIYGELAPNDTEVVYLSIQSRRGRTEDAEVSRKSQSKDNCHCFLNSM